MLSIIVQKLNNLNQFLIELKEMADRHVGYGVKPKHYNQVGSALLWTLKTGLGKDWTAEAEAAWTKCYQELTQAMLQDTNQ